MYRAPAFNHQLLDAVAPAVFEHRGQVGLLAQVVNLGQVFEQSSTNAD